MHNADPAAILGIQKGALTIGTDADISIFDLKKNWVVDEKKFFSKGKNSPFIGKKLTGKPVYTIVGGRVMFDDGKIVEA